MRRKGGDKRGEGLAKAGGTPLLQGALLLLRGWKVEESVKGAPPPGNRPIPDFSKTGHDCKGTRCQKIGLLAWRGRIRGVFCRLGLGCTGLGHDWLLFVGCFFSSVRKGANEGTPAERSGWHGKFPQQAKAAPPIQTPTQTEGAGVEGRAIIPQGGCYLFGPGPAGVVSLGFPCLVPWRGGGARGVGGAPGRGERFGERGPGGRPGGPIRRHPRIGARGGARTAVFFAPPPPGQPDPRPRPHTHPATTKRFFSLSPWSQRGGGRCLPFAALLVELKSSSSPIRGRKSIFCSGGGAQSKGPRQGSGVPIRYAWAGKRQKEQKRL